MRTTRTTSGADSGIVGRRTAAAAKDWGLRMTVVVPTYRRPVDLERCLLALAALSRPADEVIVVSRAEDASTQAVLDRHASTLPMKRVLVAVTGVVAALNAGVDASTGDVVCMTDDDAAPLPDWLARMEAHYLAMPHLAGVGGKDNVYTKDGLLSDPKPRVGVMTFFGRLIGNHHLGVGAPRRVDVLKGVNMSFRGELVRAIRFDTRLRGTGAQVHNEMALCLAIRGQGLELLYDPKVQVDHYPAERFDEDARDARTALAISNASYNFFLIVLESLSPMRREIAWQFYRFVGTSTEPGLLRYAMALRAKQKRIADSWRLCRSAAEEARRALQVRRPAEMSNTRRSQLDASHVD